MKQPTSILRVPPLTVAETVALRCAIKRSVCMFWKWRTDPAWRNEIRVCVAAYRKLQRTEVV
jgi:hypothetical protein